MEFDEESGRDVASFHPAVVVAAAPLDVVFIVSRGDYSSRLGEGMFVKPLLFDALMFVRVPADLPQSCTYLRIQSVYKFVQVPRYTFSVLHCKMFV